MPDIATAHMMPTTAQKNLNPISSDFPKGSPMAEQEAVKTKSAFARMMEKSPEQQYNIFMKMFLAQVQNQSIDNPMSTHEMTQSVMSFFQTSEMTQTNKLLKQGNDIKLQEQVSTAKSYLNKDVEYEGDVLTFNGKPERIRFDIPPNIKQAHLVICDANGKPIKNYPLAKAPGEAVIEWDGTSDAHPNKKVDNGQYIAVIHALNEEDKVVPVPTILKGKVREISYEDEYNEFVLRVNDTAVGLSDILSVSKSSNSDLMELNKNLQEQIIQTESLTKLLDKYVKIPEASTLPEQITQQKHPIWG